MIDPRRTATRVRRGGATGVPSSGMNRVPVTIIALVLWLLAGCGGDAPPSGGTEPSTSPPPSASPLAAPPGDGHQEVEFAATDGEVVSGRLFGAGEVGVVLSHMGRSGDGPDDWQAFAESLADDGFRALTYRERGNYGEIWNDVLGGVEYLRGQGATTIVAAGASIGAMSSLYAAGEPDSGINAVLWLAGVLNSSGYHFQESDVAGLGCPMLIVSGDEDSYGAGPDAERLHEWTAGFSELLMLPSRYHGTDILTEEEPEISRQLSRAMADFVGTVADQRPAECRAG